MKLQIRSFIFVTLEAREQNQQFHCLCNGLINGGLKATGKNLKFHSQLETLKTQHGQNHQNKKRHEWLNELIKNAPRGGEEGVKSL